MSIQTPTADSPTRVETHGLDVIPADERHGRPRSLFWVWASANVIYVYFALGGLLVLLGLGIWEAIAITVIGNLWWIAVGWVATSGPAAGTPAVVIMRAIFGVRGNRPDPHRAVAAQDEGDLTSEDGLAHPGPRLADELDNLPQVLGARPIAIGAPAPGLAVAIVGDVQPAVAEQPDQASLAEGSGRLLLAGREGAGAGWDTDHPDRPVRAHAGASSAGA